MAFYLQINDDSSNKIALSYFEETIQHKENESGVSFTLNCEIRENVDYSSLQSYLIPYCEENAINSLTFFEDENIIYSNNIYDKISSLFVRPNYEHNIMFTINFEKIKNSD